LLVRENQKIPGIVEVFYKVFHRSIVTLSTINIDKNETESLQQNEAIGPSLQTPNLFSLFEVFHA
jgi:hypothetical protein